MRYLTWLFLFLGVHGFAAPEPPRRPQLAVVICLDQVGGDLLQRVRPAFGTDGINRLISGGASYEDANHRHAVTSTANGHAALLTGVHADGNGIVGNEWLLADTLAKVGAVSDTEMPLVGTPPVSNPDVADGQAGASPRRLLAATVGDQLKLRYGASSRVISIAGKDRAAILMGGRLADAAYWMHDGRFVTSRYYREQLPEWVERFNGEGRVEKDFGREWNRLLDPKRYDEIQGPDQGAGEGNPSGLGPTFPHRVDGGKKEITKSFYSAHKIAPFSSEMVAELAKTAIRAEQLGRHATPDLLCVSFSQPDACGHEYGPDSHEMMDTLVRIDRMIADILACLDREVGVGNYTVVLAGDHGSAPLPERLQVGERAFPGARFDSRADKRAIESALSAQFGELTPGAQWVVRDGTSYRLRRDALAHKGIPAEKAALVLKATLAAQPQIAAAFTRAELIAAAAEGDSVLAAARRSYNAERGGDVMYVLKPYVVDRGSGTNHGTPYHYDTHVPLIWYGVGVPPGRHVHRVGTDQLAPTLTAILGISRPPQAKADRLF